MKKFKKVCLLMVVVFLLSVTVVYATDSTINIDTQGTTIGGDGNTTQKNTVNTIPTTPNTSTYKNSTNTTDLPKTGADDYLIISVVAVLGIAGVYAFKKINDYKDI